MKFYSVVFLIVLLWTGSACSTFQAKPDTVAYHRLEARALLPGAGIYPKSIVEVRVPEIVDQKKLVIPNGSAVIVSDYDRWVEPFGRGVERVLDLNVRAMLGAGADTSYDRCLVHLLEARTEADKLIVWLDYAWLGGSNRIEGAFSAEVFLAGSGMSATAEAWSLILEKAAAELVAIRP